MEQDTTVSDHDVVHMAIAHTEKVGNDSPRGQTTHVSCQQVINLHLPIEVDEMLVYLAILEDLEKGLRVWYHLNETIIATRWDNTIGQYFEIITQLLLYDSI